MGRRGREEGKSEEEEREEGKSCPGSDTPWAKGPANLPCLATENPGRQAIGSWAGQA